MEIVIAIAIFVAVAVMAFGLSVLINRIQNFAVSQVVMVIGFVGIVAIALSSVIFLATR